jgi:hypothetical protein
VNSGETPIHPDNEDANLTEVPPGGASSIDPEKVVQSVAPDDGELDPTEHPDDPRAGYQR